MNNTINLEAPDQPLFVPSQTADRPIRDTEAFRDSLPHVELDAVHALEQAIAASRARRRADAHE